MSAHVAYTPRSLLAAVLGSLQGVILQQSPPAPASPVGRCLDQLRSNWRQERGMAALGIFACAVNVLCERLVPEVQTLRLT